MKFFKIMPHCAGLACAVMGTFSPLATFAEEFPYFTRFESGFEMGSLDGQDDWQVEGLAEVREAMTPSSRRAVSLRQGNPPARVWRTFAVVEKQVAEGVYFDFFLRPTAGENADSWTVVEAGASAVLFAADEGRGEVFLLDESAGDPAWLGADFSFPLVAGNSPFFRITLRQDNGESRLFIGNRPVGVSRYEGALAGNEGELLFSIQGGSIRDVDFADFYVGNESPLPPGTEEQSSPLSFGMEDTLMAGHETSIAGTAKYSSEPETHRFDPALVSKDVVLPEPGISGADLPLQVFTPLE